MDWHLLVHFHLAPAISSLVAAVRQGPLMAAVALFVVGVFAWLTASGTPVVTLGPDPWLASAWLAGLTSVLASAFWGVGRHSLDRWRAFFPVWPRGRRAWRVYLVGRALGVWLLALLAVSVVTGPSWQALVLTVVLWVPFSALMVVLAPFRPRVAARPSTTLLPGVVAWWASKPLLFMVPLVGWLALMGWAISGNAGFVWADRPPVAGLLLDFSWTVLFGLLWSEVAAQLPYAYFRLARAGFRRVLTVTGTPVAAATAVVLVALAVLSPSLGDFARSAVLTVAGTCFWFAVWLRWGPATLAHLMGFLTLFLFGVAAQTDWWGLWALGQMVVAGVALAAWRTQYYEGERHVGA